MPDEPSGDPHPESVPNEPARSWRAPLNNPWLRNAAGVLVLVAIVGGLIAIDRVSGGDDNLGPQDDRSPKVGERAPQFVLEDTNGAARELADYEGEVVWLNFWATWCGPCRRELPDIQRIADEFADDGLVVLAVNVEEPADLALDFWDEIDIDLPILLDSDGDVANQYNSRGLPNNFFIDRDGTLHAFKLGFLTEEEMREDLAELGLR